MYQFYAHCNEATIVLIALAIILFSGFLVTRLTKLLHLPNVTGYIIAGILIGPSVGNLVPQDMIQNMGFVSDIALAFIAFGVGKFFKKEILVKTGGSIFVITILESLLAGVLVAVGMKFIFKLDWNFALALGAIATATAPASTMMTIHQYKAKGDFVNTLLQVVAYDDVVCLLCFSVVAAIINVSAGGADGFQMMEIIKPIGFTLMTIVLGFICGLLLGKLLSRPGRSKDNRLILCVAMLLGLSGLCAAIDISPLLACMVFGTTYINFTRDKKLYRQMNNFTPPIMSIFFIISGMNLDLSALKTVGVIGISYFLIRIIGKYAGAFLGCQICKTEKNIRNYLGLALIPQAGVAIGLAFNAQRILPAQIGNMILTIILFSSVCYELIGPASAKAALFLSGAIKTEKKEKKHEESASKEES